MKKLTVFQLCDITGRTHPGISKDITFAFCTLGDGVGFFVEIERFPADVFLGDVYRWKKEGKLKRAKEGSTVRAKKEAIYHACRCIHVATKEGLPWQMLVHALRQGLGFRKSKTYTLKEKDYQQYPQLREIMAKLKAAKKGVTRGRSDAQ
jgi:hypothetical protein